MSESYFNTTGLSGEQLVAAVKAAENQDVAVLAIIGIGVWSPSAVWNFGRVAGRDWLLTSVRRSMSVLEKAGALKKTGIMLDGPYGRPENTWSKA